MDLGHSDKHFNYNTRKKGSARKNFGYLLLEKLKNYILNTEVVAWRCSVKKVFLEISENSQENTCAGVFSKQSWRPQTSNFIKKETLAQVFSCEFCKIFKNTFFTDHLWETASFSFPQSVSMLQIPSLSFPQSVSMLQIPSFSFPLHKLASSQSFSFANK